MTTNLKLIASVTAAALLSGCGGGGGGGGVNELLGVMICGPLGLPADCGQRAQALKAAQASASSSATPATSASSGNSTVVTSATAAPGEFTNWSTEPADTYREIRGLGSSIYYEGRITSVHVDDYEPPYADAYYKYDAQGKLIYFRTLNGANAGFERVGHPGIDFGTREVFGDYPQTPFMNVSGSEAGVIANPYTLGWEYQSFGVWTSQGMSGQIGSVWLQSFGAATPASAVPLSGLATFNGKLGGFYVSPGGEGSMVAADVAINADFAARSLNLASGNTITTRDVSSAVAAPHLNLSGTLTYAAGSNTFRGTLVNTAGTMIGASRGQFYGPAAQELGGVFAIKSPSGVESFGGAYGAKR